ncbi:DEAD/DEAH box helicase [Chitinimonas koreensis]|uniref:DEAD/DEAH box helicase n=1 Tax=Chitinimonas koreensis TaxID=356302 RepID=UPI000419688C|nr:ATP-binding domain-containing protein [Chitinimonas koreensis]QNM95772.1 ATP-binding domain-containing protein [Chitinimonas koreensis]
MINVIWGSAREKPESSKSLADKLSSIKALSGYLYLGYPVIGSPTGPMKFDALLVSETAGLVGFDLVEGVELGDFKSRQDDIASMLDVRLKPYAGLKDRRNLKFDIHVVTYAPAKPSVPVVEEPYFIANKDSLISIINQFDWPCDNGVFKQLLAAVQVVTSIRAGKLKREPQKPNSRGAKLKRVEESIANLDQHQSQAVIETVEGVQRIRGLAGSGKTIVLALKVAYLHAQNPDWKIAVTFNTRSLKDQFKRLINAFTIEQTGAEPDWENIDILNAWGAPGDRERDGIYYKYCRTQEINFFDFNGAKRTFGEGKEFAGACNAALKAKLDPIPYYDLLLVDEAQDLPPEFLRLCFHFLKEPKRLVYAYDELQSLTGSSVLPPEELFGSDTEGNPLVLLNTEEGTTPKQDIILEKCYRNSRPLLATAHALGFGIYREKGLVQFFDQDNLWIDVGYVVDDGALRGGETVTLTRTADSSPAFLEDHSPLSDLIQFHRFNDASEQTDFLVQSIIQNIREDELKPEDIVVINPNPLTTQREVGPARQQLFSEAINSELAGVSTSADIFTKSGSVTFTGVFRAKGNEAGMVYIINAQDSFSSWSKSTTALVRNRLFTAITRAKAWVRVLGIGPGMDGLIQEWNTLQKNEYKLKFRYPTSEEKQELRLINRELSSTKRTKYSKLKIQRDLLLQAAERGDIDVDDMINELQKLKKPHSKK